jgi:hypothetical protein
VGVCSHVSQFEGRLWTHFQMDFMNTVQIMQGKTSDPRIGVHLTTGYFGNAA